MLFSSQPNPIFLIAFFGIFWPFQSANAQFSSPTVSPPSVSPLPSANNDQLIFVHTVWRHGDRTPVFTFPNDPNKEEMWGQGFGELTTRGMAQQVKLGQFLRKRYVEQKAFLSPQYSAKEIYVISTDTNRTIQSATANLIGMYGTGGARWGIDYPDVPEWPSAFVPIPVHTFEFKKDPVGLTRSFCQRTNELFDLMAQSPEYQQLNESSSTILAKVSEYSGATISLSNLWLLIEAVDIERTHGLKPPEWAAQIQPQLITINTKLINFNSGLGLKPFLGIDFATEVPKMLGGNFLWQIIERMEKKVECLRKKESEENQSKKNGRAEEKQNTECHWMNLLKYFAYSAHDMTLAALFSTFQFDQVDFDRNAFPGFASCVLVELWRESKSEEFYLKVFYRRDDDDEPMDLTRHIRGCSADGRCFLNTFRQRSLSFKPKPDTETLCRTSLAYRPVVSPPNSAAFLPRAMPWASLAVLLTKAATFLKKTMNVLLYFFFSALFALLIFHSSDGQRQDQIIADLGRLIVENCPPMLCTGLDCAVVTERNGCQLCACPIGSPARGCDPMPFVLWHDLIVNGCPNITVNTRDSAQKVHRWFRRVNRFSNTDQCEPYIFPYCPELDFNLWRSPRTKQECELYCYSAEEQRKRGTGSSRP
ncbi:hypothetical protein niasHT_023236 [Heterodera trifolii]|uniref:acid phosphatase n=1 Tax=Heterodera trifolii TaxID=157864 RepID=A0ABD2JDB7_9BILA